MREVVAVNSANTSHRCRECGPADKANRRTLACFKCMSCGHESNADLNAALNEYTGLWELGLLRVEGIATRHSLKRENIRLAVQNRQVDNSLTLRSAHARRQSASVYSQSTISV